MLDISIYSGWKDVNKLTAYQKIPATATMFRQSEIPQSVVLLESGWIKLVREEQQGQSRIIALYPPGSLLGAETLISDQCHAATGITLTDCHCYSVPAEIFLNWIRTDAQFSWQMQRTLSRRINIREIISAQSGSISTRMRLEQLIWQLLSAQNHGDTNGHSKSGNGECKLLVPLRRQELAQMISITPEHLSRLLTKMENDGVIRRCNGWLIVPNSGELWRAPEIQILSSLDMIQPSTCNLRDIIVA